jgi:virulence factor Mce-like protein
MNRRSSTTVVANPILIGASTMLVALVAVFLAYNANVGLPFVPTYDVTALVHDADQLNRHADVRIGGKRVGLVTTITPVSNLNGAPYAKLQLKLDRAVGPLPADTAVRVRPRSIIGLKYLQLTPGSSKKMIARGGTIPLSGSRGNVDLQTALNAFNLATRQSIRRISRELGDGVAGRGGDINTAIHEFDPITLHLIGVMRNLASPQTNLDGFLRGLDSAAAATAPVAQQLGGLFDGAATTLNAIARVNSSFGQVIDQTPATEQAATDALRTARPVLVRATRLATELRPGIELLPQASDRLARAIEVGTPVLSRADKLADRLSATLAALRALVRDPATSGSVVELTRTLQSLVPALQDIVPAQTVCNYLGLYFRNAPSVISEGDQNGNWFRFMPLQNTPDNPYKGKVSDNLHFDPYVDEGQNGHCVAGNEKYVPGTHIGPPPNAASAPTSNPATHPPAGVGSG